MLVSAGNDTAAMIWDVSSGRLRRTLWGHDGVIVSAEFHEVHPIVLTGSVDHRAVVWDMEKEEPIRAFTGHQGGVAARFALHGSYAVSGGGDGELRLFHLNSARSVARFVGHDGNVADVACAQVGRTIVSAGDDSTVRVWQLPSVSKLPPPPLVPESSPMSAVSARASVPRIEPLRGWSASEMPIHAIDVDSEGRRLLTVGEDRLVRMWDIDSGRELKKLAGHDDHVLDVRFAPTGQSAASCGKDGTVRLWNLNTAEETHCFHGHANWALAVAFAPDGTRLVTSGYDETLRLWDCTNRSALGVCTRPPSSMRSLAFLPGDGNYLASGGNQPEVLLWNLAADSLTQAFRPRRFTHVIADVAVLPDGKMLASAGWSRHIEVWNAADARSIAEIGGHVGTIHDIAFTPEGAGVVSASADETVRLWDIATGTELARLEGNGASMRAVAVTKDGLVIAAGWDGKVRVWRLPARAPEIHAPPDAATEPSIEGDGNS